MSRCSDGKRVSEATIKQKLSAAYKEYYLFYPSGSCEGCGGWATCTAHIIPKARCKQLNKTELIWDPVNWFRSCYTCNASAENISSDLITELLNFERIKEVYEQYDKERYEKIQRR